MCILQIAGHIGIFSSHWEVGSSMNCFVTEGGGGGGAEEEEAEQEEENSHFLQ